MTTPPRPHRRMARAALIILVVTCLAALTATHVPPGDVPSTGMSDKQMHVLGFLVLGSLVLVNLSCRSMTRARRIPLTLVILAVYAALDELTQPLTGRSCEGMDWVADMAGTAAAIAAWELLFLAARRNRWLSRLAGRQNEDDG
jgi:VanZ family protein